MNKRNISLDLMRIIACVMVVCMHSPIPCGGGNNRGPFLAALSYFTAPCIGLFFMISGALLLPVKYDYINFIKKRFGKVIWPTITWTAIYVSVKCGHSLSFDLITTILSIPFSAQGNGVLWFMYTLIGLYLLAPILSAWVEKCKKREIEIVLCLWMITLCYPILELFLHIDDSKTGVLYYFGGYAGYFLLGYYLKQYASRALFFVCAMIGLMGAIVLLIIKRHNIEIDFYRMFWYLSIFIAALCVAVWGIVREWTRKTGVMVGLLCAKISNLSFGIYLSHILIMRELFWNLEWIKSMHNYILQTFVVAFCSILSSLLLCVLISILPFSDYIIGYKHVKK